MRKVQKVEKGSEGIRRVRKCILNSAQRISTFLNSVLCVLTFFNSTAGASQQPEGPLSTAPQVHLNTS